VVETVTTPSAGTATAVQAGCTRRPLFPGEKETTWHFVRQPESKPSWKVPAPAAQA